MTEVIVVLPSPDEIKGARKDAGLTQAAAAALVHAQRITWAQWESGARTIHMAFWELFLIKTGKFLSKN